MNYEIKFVFADTLRPGDHVLDSEGQELTIKSIETAPNGRLEFTVRYAETGFYADRDYIVSKTPKTRVYRLIPSPLKNGDKGGCQQPETYNAAEKNRSIPETYGTAKQRALQDFIANVRRIEAQYNGKPEYLEQTPEFDMRKVRQLVGAYTMVAHFLELGELPPAHVTIQDGVAEITQCPPWCSVEIIDEDL